jgi:mevalonate kinase
VLWFLYAPLVAVVTWLLASFAGSGLSSSAAFVCSSFIAILAVHDIHVSRDLVAEYSAKAER